MKESAKKIIKTILFLIRKVLGPITKEPEISVLCYHSIRKDTLNTSVAPEDFEKQIQYLKKKGYQFINPNELYKYLNEEEDLPRKSILMTFDDGYKSLYINAFPILDKYEIPALMFLVGDFEVSKAARKSQEEGLTKEDRIEMEETSLITFGYHSKTHPMLDLLEPEDIEKEIESTYLYFAYPGGHSSRLVMKSVEQRGYKMAFSISPGLVRKNNSLFYIPRNVITKKTNFSDLYFVTTRAINWYQNFRNIV